MTSKRQIKPSHLAMMREKGATGHQYANPINASQCNYQGTFNLKAQSILIKCHQPNAPLCCLGRLLVGDMSQLSTGARCHLHGAASHQGHNVNCTVTVRYCQPYCQSDTVNHIVTVRHHQSHCHSQTLSTILSWHCHMQTISTTLPVRLSHHNFTTKHYNMSTTLSKENTVTTRQYNTATARQ